MWATRARSSVTRRIGLPRCAQMQALQPDVLIPGHGPVVFGRERAAQVLSDGAAVLESLVRQTLELMNQGSRLDAILHAVSAPRGSARKALPAAEIR